MMGLFSVLGPEAQHKIGPAALFDPGAIRYSMNRMEGMRELDHVGSGGSVCRRTAVTF
jgi:hypothetical protein